MALELYYGQEIDQFTYDMPHSSKSLLDDIESKESKLSNLSEEEKRIMERQIIRVCKHNYSKFLFLFPEEIVKDLFVHPGKGLVLLIGEVMDGLSEKGIFKKDKNSYIMNPEEQWKVKIKV